MGLVRIPLGEVGIGHTLYLSRMDWSDILQVQSGLVKILLGEVGIGKTFCRSGRIGQ